ncbi:hypothetical protein B0H15DRAFT_838064 [Mycena belliarum]|uniref:Large ribosomal subunit protein mL59 domain-containing protein n=1 Tax=Mycena belliarum TaxID=1033014 RepID=A0AAD6U548_9AGAR|nr:hypothetical protein B0H15DRAFT_838064 [Mycena belliae]
MSSKLIHRELKALPRFIRRNGPLPAPQAATAVVLPNPFLPWKNPKTGRWAPPKYSLRQQADLIKKSKASGTAHLLPPGVKLPEPETLAPPRILKPVKAGKASAVPKASTSVARSSPIRERLVVKSHKYKGATVAVEWDRKPVVKTVAGADKGTRLYAGKKKMFKGSRLERQIKQRSWRTWVLLHDMRKRIRRYKTNYVHRKPNPLKPTRQAAKKLPF